MGDVINLKKYREMRDFRKTKEPSGRKSASASSGNSFVVHEHHARRLHWDLRLEWKGVLKSWAVPKGPPTESSEKRLAVEVEDHPLEYANFQGTIPEGEYGAGLVKIWDRGTWEPIGDPDEGLSKGRLTFRLRGRKLKGQWSLVRMKTKDKKKTNWLLLKSREEKAPTEKRPTTDRKTARKSLQITPDPQLPTLVDEAPDDKDWVHEVKYDGYRTIAHKDGDQVTLWSRGGFDWTHKYQQIADELRRLPAQEAWIDGEIVVVDSEGHSDFSLLQEALSDNAQDRLLYYVFDLLAEDGEDLRPFPLIERKTRLHHLTEKLNSSRVLYSEHWTAPGSQVLEESCRLGLEGIVSKKATSPYRSGRGRLWVKAKCANAQEFVVGGYTAGKAGNSGLGALVLGYFDHAGRLIHVGRVGTGFTQKTMRDLLKKMKPLKMDKSPFHEWEEKNVQWVKPELVVEVKFRGFTRDRVLRQAAYRGIRMDKAAQDVGLDRQNKIKLTNPDKLLYPKDKISKQDVWNYMEEMAPLLLLHLMDRPLALVRCPDGIGGECFYQKKLTGNVPNALHEEKIRDPTTSAETFIYIDSEEGLLALAQLGVLEIHAWGTRRQHFHHPDQIVFDFDPGPGISLRVLREAASELREMLNDLGLQSFLKVSGGKGYHVHIPIDPIYSWDQVKSFSQALAAEMARRKPDLYLINMSKAKREGKIFIDYLRNSYGSTAIAPYSLRSRDGASVALPIPWEDLTKVKPDQFKMKKVLRMIKEGRPDPWKEMWGLRQKIAILDES